MTLYIAVFTIHENIIKNFICCGAWCLVCQHVDPVHIWETSNLCPCGGAWYESTDIGLLLKHLFLFKLEISVWWTYKLVLSKRPIICIIHNALCIMHYACTYHSYTAFWLFAFSITRFLQVSIQLVDKNLVPKALKCITKFTLT